MSKSYSVRPEGRHIHNKIFEVEAKKLDLFRDNPNRDSWSYDKQARFHALESEILKLCEQLEPYKVYA